MLASYSSYAEEGIDILKRTKTADLDRRMERVIDHVASALAARLPVLICGNGGSASDAMHIAGELASRFLIERPGLKAIALGANVATLTAWSNDYAYETVYARQVEAYGEPGGVVWGLSTSGNSKNIIAAFERAKAMKMTTVAMTGEGGGKLASLADVLLDVPSRSTPRIQEVHISMYHYICQCVEERCAAALLAGGGEEIRSR